MRRFISKALFGATLTFCLPTAALAAPGLGDEVYGATVEKGEPEFEARYGRLDGKSGDGEDALKLEGAYGVTHNLRLAVVGEFTRDPGSRRQADSMAVEAIYALGNIGGIDIALYGEYEVGFLGPDKIETKLLVQRRTGPWDLRLNLIGEKALAAHEPVELGYAVSIDRTVCALVRRLMANSGPSRTSSRTKSISPGLSQNSRLRALALNLEWNSDTCSRSTRAVRIATARSTCGSKWNSDGQRMLHRTQLSD